MLKFMENVILPEIDISFSTTQNTTTKHISVDSQT